MKHSDYWKEKDPEKRRKKMEKCVKEWDSFFLTTDEKTPKVSKTQKKKFSKIPTYDDGSDQTIKEFNSARKKESRKEFKQMLQDTVGTEWLK